MSKKLVGTKTITNLLKSFAGESQARSRYTMFQKRAECDGFEHIGAIFAETADNERIHAEQFYKHIIRYAQPGEVLNLEIQATYPAILSDTLENLKAAAAGENEEALILYPQFAEIAENEGFSEIAFTFRNIALVEKLHEERYLDLADNVRNELVFKRPKEVVWKCMKCGYHHFGTTAPKACPACGHPHSVFELYARNY